MSEYRHGIRVIEEPTGVSTPVNGTSGLQVVVGTAPVHTKSGCGDLVNHPVVAYSYEDAVKALGYSDDWEKYTICQSMYAAFQVYNVSPVVFINVLDPDKNVRDGNPVVIDCTKNREHTFASADVVLDSIRLTVPGDGEVNPTELEAGVDYVATVDDNGHITVTVLEGGEYGMSAAITVTSKEVSFERGEMAKQIVGGIP